jgi:hypothetical protein
MGEWLYTIPTELCLNVHVTTLYRAQSIYIYGLLRYNNITRVM